MKIEKSYKISGLVIGLALGLVSLVFTFPIFLGIFGIFLLASESRLLTPAWLIIIGPLAILVTILTVCYHFGSKIGKKFEADIQNEEKNKKRAVLILWVAILFLILGVALFFLGASNIRSNFESTALKGAETMNAGIAEEKAYEQYATIGDVNIEPQGSTTFINAVNGKMTEVSLFKKLVFTVPISVSHAGTYEIYVRYNSNSSFYANSDSPSNFRQVLGVGDHIIKLEFVAGEAPNLGYESPKSVQGKVSIELNYLATRKELLDSMKSDNTVGQKVLQQFMKDEGLDQGVNTDSTVNKFVGKKEVQF